MDIEKGVVGGGGDIQTYLSFLEHKQLRCCLYFKMFNWCKETLGEHNVWGETSLFNIFQCLQGFSKRIDFNQC